MNEEQQQQFYKAFVERQLAGISNLSDYPTKAETEEKLRKSIKPDNIATQAQIFFTEQKEDGTKL